MAAVTMHHFSGLAAPFVRSKGTISGGVFILFNLPDYFISELLLECNTSFVCLIESKREALGSVAGKCTFLCLHISSLQLCVLALFSFAYP